MSPSAPQISARAGRRRSVLVWMALATALVGLPSASRAAVGSVLFADDFESGFGNWTTTNTNRSGINFFTANSAVNSLYVRGDTVTTTSIAINTAVPAIRVEAWIRRGSDAFSEDTDTGDDLVVEYLDGLGAWINLTTELGSGTKGEIITLSTILGGDALHPGFRIRVRLTSGSGGPPQNAGIGWDYWHIDDLRILEAAPPKGFALGSCEDFERGLGNWTVSGSGNAQITTQTANSIASSLALFSRSVTVTSQIIDLSRASQLVLRPWIRRGSDSFSEDPDPREDIAVEFLDDTGSWILLEQFRGNGRHGEIFQPQYPLPGSAAHANFRIRFRKLDGNNGNYDYWHVDDVCLDGTALLAEWRFEDGLWTGATGELQDSSGNGFGGAAVGAPQPGLATPALGTDPGTCGYAQFNGLSDGFEIPHSPALNGTDTLSYTAWVYPRTWLGTRQIMAKSVHGGGSGRAQMGLFSESGLLRGRAETANGRIEISAPLPPTNQWSHIALAYSSGSLSLFVNGALVASTSVAPTSLVATTDPLVIGKRFGSATYFFDGYIDEARVYGTALDLAAVQQIAAETHDCPNTANGFLVAHDGSGFHCQQETITVTAQDLAGNTVQAFAGPIVLDTQSGSGTWSLTQGQGAFSDPTADDGLAHYTFVPADLGRVTFALDYRQGPASIDVDAYMGVARDDDSEGPLVFSPTGFTLTANALPNPPPSPIVDPIPTSVAGRTFPLHIAAYGTNPSDGTCGIIETYDGDRPVRFWIDYHDPVSGPIVPSVDSNPIGASEAAAADQIVRFNQGQAQVAVKYKDVGRISLGAADRTSAPAPIRGTSNAFVSPPADFVFNAITTPAPTLAPNLGGATPAGPLFARAGEPFRVQVEVRDFENSITPSYGLESTPEGIRIRSFALVAPAGGRNGTTDTGLIQNATAFGATAVPGRFEGTTFAFDEVGAIELEASVADADYLGSGPVVGSPSGTVGRFAPSRFEVVANNPQFDTSCPTGAFSWVGQPFSFVAGQEPVLTVTAVNAAGTTTQNYRDGWWKLTNASLAGRSYRAATVAIDESGLPDPAADPTIVSAGDGTGTLTFSAGTGLRVTRGAPLPPFDLEVEIAIDVLDEDATAFASNPFTLGGTTPASGVVFNVSKRFQYGRLRIDNAFGSELVDLAMNLRTQRFDGGAFTDDLNDSCSVIPVSSLSLVPTPGALSTTPQINNAPLLSGNAGLVLGAPNAQGEVSLLVDLGPGGANLPWLRFDWPEDGNLDGSNDDDPRAKAVFGIWSGRDTMIYIKESY